MGLSTLIILSAVISLSSCADIPLGTVLRPGDPSAAWLSPNKDFALTFAAAGPPSSLFLPAIAFSGGAARVWAAPAAVDAAGFLELRADGNLRLVTGGGAVAWETRTGGAAVSAAVLLDSGNLQLVNRTAVVWDSFAHPSDTLAQAQNFTPAMALRSGLYSFSLLPNGNLTLSWNGTVVYLNRGLASGGASSLPPLLSLLPDGVVALDGVAVGYSSDYGGAGVFRFLRLDPDGNLRAYSVGRGGREAARWAAVADQCEVFGWCGENGVCGYGDAGPVCGCASGDFFWEGYGCRRRRGLESCGAAAAMVRLERTKFLAFPPELAAESAFLGIAACEEDCLLNSSCAGSTSLGDGTGVCLFKPAGFLSGYGSAALQATSFVKVCRPPAAAAGKAEASPPWVALVGAAGAVAGVLVVEAAAWWWLCRRGAAAPPPPTEFSAGPAQFSYGQLRRCTKNFSSRLGEGGFGAVYRGELPSGAAVAVKRLEGLEQGEKEFRTEVAAIGSTHHLNLVRLLGYCAEGKRRLLVYELMENGSLDAALFSADTDPPLPWRTRMSIAVGAAKGIAYLHEECRECIVHCDIKPENILLDGEFGARVSDFGLAELGRHRRSRRGLSVRGTRGYVAPEWLGNGAVTAKADVYSFGMVLVEMVAGRRSFEETAGKRFWVWAYEEVVERMAVERVLDRRLNKDEVDMAEAERAALVAFWCVQEQPGLRPAMGTVVQMLEGLVEVCRPPHPSAAANRSESGGSLLSTVPPAPSSSFGSLPPPGGRSLSSSSDYSV
ncbi:lectin protein kinase family protein [Wolffia australiana]